MVEGILAKALLGRGLASDNFPNEVAWAIKAADEIPLFQENLMSDAQQANPLDPIDADRAKPDPLTPTDDFN